MHQHSLYQQADVVLGREGTPLETARRVLASLAPLLDAHVDILDATSGIEE